ncbi:MAG: transcriptional repressor [Calditrichaeota bacterium]|nr:transcriptional repressor [Calditrichota bacterium]RQW04931.1 MAG: transcriptional repressor [Calditrichota bacterium]
MEKKSKMEWHGRFRGRGLRFTIPRRLILETLSSTIDHLSAEEIYIRVHRKYPNVGLTTVYRTLDLLERMGIISRFQFGDGRSRFELVQSSTKAGHHHHLVCTSCKQVIDYDDFVEEEVELLKKVEKALAKKHGFEINGHVIQFYGVCNNCQKQP